MRWGTFYGIGVGPGDPELLTLKARRILEEIDVLLVPESSEEKRSLALSIVSAAVMREWECIELILPMTRDRNVLHKYWKAAAHQVLEVLKTGRDAAFITLGDPTLYSTFTYLFKYVKEFEPSVTTEIIPGISSVNSVSAWIQQPLAEGEESLVIVPALRDAETLEAIMDRFDNVVLLKAGRQVGKIAQILNQSEYPASAVLACRCGFEDGFYTNDLSSLDHKKLDYLSTVMIKKRRGDENR